jgi:hypothetical protein
VGAHDDLGQGVAPGQRQQECIARELPTVDQRLHDAIDAVTEVVKADAGVNTGLELAIPLIPHLLDYKVKLDLGGSLNLRQWWEKIVERFRSS